MIAIRMVLVFVLAALAGCFGEPPLTAESEDESSSSSSSNSESSGTAPDASSTAMSSSGELESSSESSGSGSSESSGEERVDWALAFDGTSYGRKINDGGAVPWTVADFTVEVWVEIQATSATGVIFDSTDAAFTTGWVLYFHNDMHALVFSFFDDAHSNQVIVGPSVEEIGTGWHHLAATKSGGQVFIHVDGTAMMTASVPPSMAFDQILWSLGGNAVGDPAFRLINTALDDLRVSGFPRYEAKFDPPVAYDDDAESVILLLRLDEGEGVVASDAEASEVSFSVESPSWVPGNSG